MKKRLVFLIVLWLSACGSLSSGTPEPIRPPKAALGWVYQRQADDMPMVYVPGGTFTMGSLQDFPNAVGDETPAHRVTVSGFWIDRTPVTNAQYALCVEDRECRRPRQNSSEQRESYYDNPFYADYPVVYVNWEDASDYCQWAGAKLPTEAQWEYAARGPNNNLYPWGNSAPNDDLADWGQPGGDTAAVDTHPDGKSWVGALEMSGNVWEWMADWYIEYSEDAQTDPTGPGSGRRRVVRGGSYLNGVEGVRGASRNLLEPDFDDYPFVGIRCAADVAE